LVGTQGDDAKHQVQHYFVGAANLYATATELVLQAPIALLGGCLFIATNGFMLGHGELLFADTIGGSSLGDGRGLIFRKYRNLTFRLASIVSPRLMVLSVLFTAFCL
jgi:hypothetical protein